MLGLGLSIPQVAARTTGVGWWHASQHLLDGVVPGFFADVLNGRYSIGNHAAAIGDLLTVTNASTIRRYCGADGAWAVAAANTPRISWMSFVPELLLEGAATNLFLNSGTPATQSVAVTARAYTLSFEGSGSITRSGTSTGSTTGAGSGPRNRVSATFTPTAGSLTLTISGTVEKVQLETGSAASSYIPTTSATVTRPADLCQLTSTAANVLQGAGAAVAWRGGAVATTTYQTLIGSPSTARLFYLSNGDPASIGADSPAAPFNISASAVAVSPIGAALGWGPSGRIGSANGLTAIASAATLAAARTQIYLGGSAGLTTGQILCLRQLVGWSLPDLPSAAAVQAQARVAS